MSDDEGCCVMSVITHFGPAASTWPSAAGNEAGHCGGPAAARGHLLHSFRIISGVIPSSVSAGYSPSFLSLAAISSFNAMVINYPLSLHHLSLLPSTSR